MIYLDSNATTEPLAPVQAAIGLSLTSTWHNPSSVHRPGQVARQAVELARRDCAALIGAKPRSVVFTGSGSESVALGIGGALRAGRGGALLTTRVEHAAVRKLGESMESRGEGRVLWAEVDGDGVVELESVRALLGKGGVGLVSIQWANNETGAVQPVHEVARLCREHGVLFHCDATQWVGKMPTDVATLGADLLTYSAHKIHGPKGLGVLWIRPGVSVAPMVYGEQEMGRHGGTENVPGIVGAGVAARLAAEWLAGQRLDEQDSAARLGEPDHQKEPGQRELSIQDGASLRDVFERLVLGRVPGARVNGPRERAGESVGTRRLWNTTNIGFPRLEAEALLLLLSERGVCASAGAACSSGSLDPSPVLLAMKVPAELAHGSLRFSLSRFSTREEVERAAEVVVECVGKLTASMKDLGGRASA